MKIDKYRDMALRNPIGCTWWKWLSNGIDKDDQPGWRACARCEALECLNTTG